MSAPPPKTDMSVRERLSGGSADATHCHMLFHLPHPYTGGRKRKRVEEALDRLIDKHGDGNYADYTLKLKFPNNPNGVYLLKGGEPEVWHEFDVPRCWRKPQGVIEGKRCGTTENIGASARRAAHEPHDPKTSLPRFAGGLERS